MKNNKILLINKTKNITSNKIIQNIKILFKIKKIGYCGTLDPSATGLLIICIGNKTKILNKIRLYRKTYIIFAITGIKSITNDLDGHINFYQKNKKLIKLFFFKKSIKNIKKKETQHPQIYSSIKHNGINLYKFARIGIRIKIKKRYIKIHKINVISTKNNLIILKIICAQGVYIRSIIEELSKNIKKPICTVKIIRLKLNKYKITNAFDANKIIKKISYFK